MTRVDEYCTNCSHELYHHFQNEKKNVQGCDYIATNFICHCNGFAGSGKYSQVIPIAGDYNTNLHKPVKHSKKR